MKKEKMTNKKMTKEAEIRNKAKMKRLWLSIKIYGGLILSCVFMVFYAILLYEHSYRKSKRYDIDRFEKQSEELKKRWAEGESFFDYLESSKEYEETYGINGDDIIRKMGQLSGYLVVIESIFNEDGTVSVVGNMKNGDINKSEELVLITSDGCINLNLVKEPEHSEWEKWVLTIEYIDANHIKAGQIIALKEAFIKSNELLVCAKNSDTSVTYNFIKDNEENFYIRVEDKIYDVELKNKEYEYEIEGEQVIDSIAAAYLVLEEEMCFVEYQQVEILDSDKNKVGMAYILSSTKG